MTMACLGILSILLFVVSSLLILIFSSLHVEFLTQGGEGSLALCIRIKWLCIRGEGSFSRVNKDQYASMHLWGHRLFKRKVRSKSIPWRSYLSRPNIVELTRSIPDNLDNLIAPVRSLFRHIHWEVIRIAGQYGFEDPSLTGWTAGIVYSLSVVVTTMSIPVNMDIEPNFERPLLQMDTEIGFSFRPYRFVTPAAKVIYFFCTNRR